MLGRGVGLAELVEAARDRVDVAAYELLESTAALVLEEACRFAWCGQFDMALRVASCRPAYFNRARQEELESLADGTDFLAFAEVVALAGRIDGYLAALESDRRMAGLARQCREELDLLLILADLCEDSSRPHAAAEARYFHCLADATRESLARERAGARRFGREVD